ncbi:MAG: hypothetical protein ABI877_04440, partial [Gemmatimonadaceae bacterium]
GFLEATLRAKREYLPMFRDHRVVGQWLPKTMYVTRFQENNFRSAADFEEDVDVTTGSVPGVTLAGDSLSTWKEAAVPFRSRNSNMAHNAVWLGWSNRVAGDDTAKRAMPATYTIALTDSLRGAWRVDSSATLVFSLAPTDATPGPRSSPRDTTKAADSTKKKTPPKKKPAPKVKPDSTPFDLTVEVVDADGKTASAPLSRYGAVRRPLESYVYLRKGRDKQRFANLYELVLQTYTIPLHDFAVGGAVDLTRLRGVRLRFDRTLAGTVVLDNIGFSHMSPEFFARGATTVGGKGEGAQP